MLIKDANIPQLIFLTGLTGKFARIGLYGLELLARMDA